MTHSVVVGGAGFVGSWVVQELLKKRDSRVTIVDNLISSEKSNIPTDPRVVFVEGSATNFKTFEKISFPVDTLYQFACFHGNQSSIARPLDDLENSLKTTLVTLEWIKNKSPKTRVIYSSAGCAIAEKTWDAPNPVKELEYFSLSHDSPYSITKLSGEMYCLYYANYHNIDVVRVRFQNVYGPREILGAGSWRGTKNTVWRNVIPTFIWKALNNDEIEIYGKGSRDFIFVEDVVRGVLLASKNGKKGGVYNIASGVETSIEKLALKILRETRSKSHIKYCNQRDWDNSGRRVGDTSTSSAALGFEPSVSLQEGLALTVEWTKENANEIQKRINYHKKNMNDI